MAFKVGLIGNRAHQNVYGPILQARSDCEIVAAAEHNLEKAQALEQLYGISVSQDYDAVLENPDVDFVSICTDFYLKHQLIPQAVACGKHVMVDKAIARTVREARDIVQAVEGSAVKVALMYPSRFRPALRILAEGLREDAYGRVVAYVHTSVKQFEGDLMSYVSYPTPARQNGGGELMNLGSHPVDYLYSVFGYPKRVYCHMVNAYFDEYRAFETEDIATLFCEYDGFVATMTTGRNKARDKDLACQALDITCEGNWIRVDGAVLTVNGDVVDVPEASLNPSEACVQHLIDCIQEDRVPESGMHNGLAVAVLTTAAYQSAQSGGFVDLPLEDETHPMISADEQVLDTFLE